MQDVLIRLYAKTLFLVFAMICYLFALFKKKRIIKWEEAPRENQNRIKRGEKKINIIIYLISGFLLLACFKEFVIPALFDIPNVLKGNYLEVRGVVESWNYSDENKIKERAIGVIDEKTQEEKSIIVYSKGIHKGEYVWVYYLPYSRYGIVIEEQKYGNKNQ